MVLGPGHIKGKFYQPVTVTTASWLRAKASTSQARVFKDSTTLSTLIFSIVGPLGCSDWVANWRRLLAMPIVTAWPIELVRLMASCTIKEENGRFMKFCIQWMGWILLLIGIMQKRVTWGQSRSNVYLGRAYMVMTSFFGVTTVLCSAIGAIFSCCFSFCNEMLPISASIHTRYYVR